MADDSRQGNASKPQPENERHTTVMTSKRIVDPSKSFRLSQRDGQANLSTRSQSRERAHTYLRLTLGPSPAALSVEPPPPSPRAHKGDRIEAIEE
jgi:hypothetical protein